MTPQNPHYDIAYRIDSICLQFADQLRQSTTGADRPSIESLLQQHSDLPRQQLLECLLSEELEYLTVQGQKPDANRLRQRFPQDHAIIDKALSRNPVKQAVPDECATQLAPADAASEGSQPKKKHPRVSTPAPHISGFDMLEGLGEGGMGAVFQAYDRRYKRTVAIKIIHRRHQANPQIKLRFENEIFALKRLSHANIVRVHESGEKDEVLYYSMDYVDGLNLELLIRAAQQAVNQRRNTATAMTPHQAADSTLPPDPASAPLIRKGSSSGNHKSAEGAIEYPSEDFIRFCTQRSRTENHKATKDIVQIGIDVANAMQHAHDAGVIHRDLKPNNLLLDKNGRIWVADFGLAQAQDATPLTMTGHVHGTLKYMSPEQLLGGQVSIDRCTDMYSLGATLYELLCLEPVREGNNSQEIRNKVAFGEPVSLRRRNPAIPRDLETIIHKAISHRPRDRYQTMQELSDDLRRFQRHEPILAKPAGPLKRLSLWVEREQKLAASLAASAALLIVILGLLLVLVNGDRIKNGLLAEQKTRESAEAKQALRDSEAARYLAISQETRTTNPSLATELAIKSLNTSYSPEGYTALALALRENHHHRTWALRPETVQEGAVALNADKRSVITTANVLEAQRHKTLPAVESDVVIGKVIHEYSRGGVAFAAQWSADGKYLLTLESDSFSNSDASARIAAYLWQRGSNDGHLLLEGTVRRDHLLRLGTIWPAAFNRESSQLILADHNTGLHVFSVPTGAPQGSPEHLRSLPFINAMAFDLKQNRVAIIAADNTVTLVNLDTWNTTLKPFPIHIDTNNSRQPTSVAFLGDDRLIIACDSGTVVHSLLDGRMTHESILPETRFTKGDENEILITYGGNRRLILRNFTTLEPLREYLTGAATNVIYEPLLQRSLIHHVNHTNSSLPLNPNNDSLQLPKFPDTCCPPQPLSNNQYLLITKHGNAVVWMPYPISSRFQISSECRNPTMKTFSVSPDSQRAAVTEHSTIHTKVVPLPDGPVTNVSFTGKILETGPRANWVCIEEKRDTTSIKIANGLIQKQETHLFTNSSTSHRITKHNLLLIRTNDNRVLQRDTVSGLETSILAPGERCTSLHYSEQQSIVAMAMQHGDCRIVNLETMKTHNIKTRDSSPLTTIAIDETKKRILFTDRSGHLYIRPIDDATTETSVIPLPNSPYINEIRISPNGEFVLCWHETSTAPILLVSLRDNTTIALQVPGNDRHCTFSQDMNDIFIGTTEGLFNRPSNPNAQINNLSNNEISGVEWTPHGLITIEKKTHHISQPFTATAHTSGAIHPTVLTVRQRDNFAVSRQIHLDGQPESLHISSDSTVAFVALRVWPSRIVGLGDEVDTIYTTFNNSPIIAQTFTPDSKVFVSVSADGVKTEINIQTGRAESLAIPTGKVLRYAAISNDGKCVVAVDRDGKVITFDGESIQTWDSLVAFPEKQPVGIVFPTDGGSVAVYSSTGLWTRSNVRSAAPLVKQVLKAPVLDAVWTKDSQSLLIATDVADSDKGQVFLYNPRTSVITSVTINAPPLSIAISPDDSKAIVVTRDGDLELVLLTTHSSSLPGKLEFGTPFAATRVAWSERSDLFYAITDIGVLEVSVDRDGHLSANKFRVDVSTAEDLLLVIPEQARLPIQSCGDRIFHTNGSCIEHWPRSYHRLARLIEPQQ